MIGEFLPFQSLPIDEMMPQILNQISSKPNVILTAAPGAGKTTRLPPKLLDLTKKKILVLEPRRVAALAAAQRVSEENSWQLGGEVGYQVRFDNRSDLSTRLIFITEALLSKKLIHDPELSDIGIVVIDEFHERSLHTDLALGLLFELQQMSRPDLKIIVMSATIDAKAISEYLKDSAIIEVPGQSFPLQVHLQNESQLLQTGPQFIDAVVDKIKSAVALSQQNVLAFLPGVGEIHRVQNRIEEWCAQRNLVLQLLYGSLSLNEQKKVLQPSKGRKLVLCTNVAESALTIDGVSCVVDSGLERNVTFNTSTCLPKIQIARISKASAKQRAGRAARQQAGQVFRMWNKLDELSMPDFSPAEIFKADLTESLLLLARMGIKNFDNFSWFEKAPANRMKVAQEQLITWGALNSEHQLSPIGKKMSELPLHPRLARIMIEAERLGCIRFASEICAILSEKDFLQVRDHQESSSSDIFLRWELLDKGRQQDRFLSHIKLAKAIEQNFSAKGDKTRGLAILPELLLPAYVDLLCRRRNPKDSKAIKIDGSGVALTSSSTLKEPEFFVALQLMEGVNNSEATVNMASEIPFALIQKNFSQDFKEEIRISFEQKSQRLNKMIIKKLHGMPLDQSRPVPLNDKDLAEHLPLVALAQWPWLLRENEELQNWMERFEWFRQQQLPFPVPEFSDTDKLSVLTKACFDCRNLQDLKGKDLVYFFETHLSSEILNLFKSDCPAFITVPTGNRLKIKYFVDKDPVLEVRLQEIFGWSETPKVLSGKINITLHLLGPNYRPLQVTQDLSNFWKGAYQEVRRQLRARYPKHSWPEDPLSAKPVAKGRSQKS